MKAIHEIVENAIEIENAASLCFGVPQGDELPQIASTEDILIDIYSDIFNAPREFVSSILHHQYVGDYEDMIH